ncbi:MAG: hypothetical protein NZO58_01555, partial [Gemmataceae bacterium]|nr:hypothetical protein [Gemmataceae bacterium]
MAFWKFAWLRQLIQGRKPKGPARRKRRDPLLLEHLEHRLAPADGRWLFTATAPASLTLRLADDQLQIVDELDQVLAAREWFSTSQVTIAGNGHDVALRIDVSFPRLPGGVLFDGGSGLNHLIGPDGVNVEWHITGPDSGFIQGLIDFYGVENLTGGVDNEDTFIVAGGGSISGRVEGGDRGFDTVRFTGQYSSIGYRVTDFDSGIISLDGVVFYYDGMEPIQFTQATETFTYEGTAGDDTIIVSDIPDVGSLRMQISGTGELVQFANPTEALIIKGRNGSDTITVHSVDPEFAAELKIYGNHGDAPQPLEDGGTDTVTFAGNVDTKGAYLEVFADHITVNDNVTLSTRTTDPDGESSDIVFRARRFNVPEIQNLSPLIVQTKVTSVTIGAGAVLRAASIYLYSQSEDRSLAQLLGIDRRVDNLIIQPLTSKVTDLLALPAKVLLKAAEASISINAGAQLLGEGLVGLYASAATTSDGVAKSVLGSVGFAQAQSTSTVTIGPDVVIDSGDAVVITSAANAEAKMSTKTARNLGDVPGGNATQISVSMAVTNAEATSHINVHATATITAAKTANIRSTGDIASEAEAEAGVFADGTAALSMAIELSKADIQTTVNGRVTANMETSQSKVAGATVTMTPLVKLEFDPTETDPTKPGYIDFENNTINVGHTTLVTEDTVTYQNRRGNSIGNLVDGQEYVVISVPDDPNTEFNESWLIKLALTEQKAIDGEEIDLTPGFPAVAVNTKYFDGDDVDGERNTITLDNPAFTGAGTLDFSLRGSTFELGQAVVFRQGNGPAIPGLVDGGTYYIITGVN